MDLSADAALEATAPTQDADLRLPELSRSQTTLDVAEDCSLRGPALPSPVIPVAVSAAVVPALDKRKSVRLRPAEIIDRQHADPLPLMSRTAAPPAPQLRPKTSKMSLFSLFSRPKVEKLRGYAESGLDGPSRASSNSTASTTGPAQPQHADAQTGKLRPSTSKSYSANSANQVVKEPLPSVPHDQTGRMRSFAAPPLFQVWPQATKHASLEVSALEPDMTLQKSRNRMLGTTLFVPGTDLQSTQMAGNRVSIDSRITTKTNHRQIATGLGLPVNLPTKLVVLVTSGYLLQYAASGPSDRYPEKVLQLQRESAAYASDVIPGKHHVLQVVQAVPDNGVVVAPSPGLFSKLGLRTQATRPSTANLLLVMPGAEDMEEWMTAIRQEIERQGGKRARPESSTSRVQQNGSSKLDLRKTPSLSHRYQVTRQASIANVSPIKPQAECVSSPPAISKEKRQVEITDKGIGKDSTLPRDATPSTRPRASSDTPSAGSSTGQSEHRKQLEKLRDSTQSSHASTMATTVASTTSRTNSLTSTPPTELLRDFHELQQDYITAKGPYRNLASYSLPKRRSNAPLPLVSEPLSPRAEAGRAVVERPLDSPVLPNSQMKPLSLVQSAPDLKHVRKPEPELRPESFLADLPDPSAWASMTMPGHKSSLQHSQSSPEIPQARTLYSGQARPLRNGSQSFSLPLKINPKENASQRAINRRASRSTEADAGIRSPIPAATTLIAKVDPMTAITEKSRPGYGRISFVAHAAAATAVQPGRTASSRLSLFPPAAPQASAPSLSIGALRRSPSVATNTVFMPQVQQAGSLRRPASLQVRTDRAPFLSSFRASPVPPNTQPRSATAPPIRSLKPSRSATAIPYAAARTPSPADTFNFSTRRTTDEETDQAMPLPTRCDSPFKLPNSRKVRASTSLPELDFGMPLIGLGPPAPPPRTPLPELPRAGRPSSRAISRASSKSESTQEMRSGPIGVALSGSPINSPGSPLPSLSSVGLGIEVGGR